MKSVSAFTTRFHLYFDRIHTSLRFQITRMISDQIALHSVQLAYYKYHSWYFNCLQFYSPNGSSNYVQQFRNITRGIYAKYHYKSCYYLFVIFTSRYFKLSWNTTALSQSNCRNFSCSSITDQIAIHPVQLAY